MTTPFPIRVTFRNLDRSRALETRIRRWAERLVPLGSEIIDCEVVLEALSRSPQRPRLFRARVELAVPGNDIIASSDVHDEEAARDPFAAVRQALEAAERQLLDRSDRQRARPEPDRWPSEVVTEEPGADE